MYYKSVNRGLNFTVIGRYLIGLTLGIGAIAVITGINGMFLFLGLCLGMLGISGLISEKNLKICSSRCDAIDTFMDVGTPSALGVIVNNESPNVEIFGLETQLAFEKPYVKFLRFRSQPIGQTFTVHLPSNQSTHFQVPCTPEKRGFYNKIYLIQRTTFPFGIFLKI